MTGIQIMTNEITGHSTLVRILYILIRFAQPKRNISCLSDYDETGWRWTAQQMSAGQCLLQYRSRRSYNVNCHASRYSRTQGLHKELHMGMFIIVRTNNEKLVL